MVFILFNTLTPHYPCVFVSYITAWIAKLKNFRQNKTLIER